MEEGGAGATGALGGSSSQNPRNSTQTGAGTQELPGGKPRNPYKIQKIQKIQRISIEIAPGRRRLLAGNHEILTKSKKSKKSKEFHTSRRWNQEPPGGKPRNPYKIQKIKKIQRIPHKPEVEPGASWRETTKSLQNPKNPSARKRCAGPWAGLCGNPWIFWIFWIL